MDSITHIALGACMGEAFAGKQLGKKAMIWGAIAQSVPDIDFVASFWMDTPSDLLAHRGFTHSFLFCALITPLFALTADRLHRPHNMRLRQWMLFFGALIFIHVFIDAFNNYGVGWFEPFSHVRISFNAIYVADPLFSIWPVIASALLIYHNRRHPRRSSWWRFGLGFSSIYLMYCLANKAKIDHEVNQAFVKQDIPVTRYFSTPAPLQNWVWFVVAGTDSGYHVGFRSVFDKKKEIDFEYFPRNSHLLKPVEGSEDLQKLIRFSQQFYTVEQWGDTLVFNDLRFGQIIGWHKRKNSFVFHYYLNKPEGNELIVQRGRFTGWNKHTALSLLRRIKGY